MGDRDSASAWGRFREQISLVGLLWGQCVDDVVVLSWCSIFTADAARAEVTKSGSLHSGIIRRRALSLRHNLQSITPRKGPRSIPFLDHGHMRLPAACAMLCQRLSFFDLQARLVVSFLLRLHGVLAFAFPDLRV